MSSIYFPELKRPQYPSSPEILLSALAWSVVERPSSAPEAGLIYVRKESKAKRGVQIRQTKPKDGDELASFTAALLNAGVRTKDGGLPSLVVDAIADSLVGVRSDKGVGYTSSAIGLCGALLQDPIGGLGAANPPNFANLLNTMYALGGGSGSAAERWFDVASHYAGDPVLSRIEEALASTSLSEYLPQAWPQAKAVLAEGAKSTTLPDWWTADVLNQQLGTPFSWFRDSWDRLCSEQWYTALSPRKWSAWAVCVLRNALGFAFLWEANFFAELARGVRDGSRDAANVARLSLLPSRPLIPYQKGSIAQMDVMPSMRQSLIHGSTCRKAIEAVLKDEKAGCKQLADVITLLRTKHSNELKERLEVFDDSGTTNLVETVRYSLIARTGSDVPDHYAFLRRVNRNFTHVSPGPEWIVVMAAMSSSSPRCELRLGDVQRQLDALGLKPRIDFLLSELERAGLCAGAADGDEGIEINLGIGGK